jgi:hypothetical protein
MNYLILLSQTFRIKFSVCVFKNTAASESLRLRTYGNRPIHEAMDDQQLIVDDLKASRSLLLGNDVVDVMTTTITGAEDRESLATAVRKFVADSKDFVATACKCAATTNGDDISNANIELRPVTEQAVRTLASVSVACWRLTVAAVAGQPNADSGGNPPLPLAVVAQLVDYTLEVATVFGDMLDSSRLIVDSRSESGRRFAIDAVNGHAVKLARVLVSLVQRVRTM